MKPGDVIVSDKINDPREGDFYDFGQILLIDGEIVYLRQIGHWFNTMQLEPDDRLAYAEQNYNETSYISSNNSFNTIKTYTVLFNRPLTADEALRFQHYLKRDNFVIYARSIGRSVESLNAEAMDLYNQGIALRELHSYPQAMEMLELSYQTNPKEFYRAKNQQGLCYMSEDNFAEAMRCFTISEEDHCPTWFTNFYMGGCLYKTGDIDKALPRLYKASHDSRFPANFVPTLQSYLERIAVQSGFDKSAFTDGLFPPKKPPRLLVRLSGLLSKWSDTIF